jgi:hypothetical protein
MINIDFEKTDGINTLKDALYLPDDHGLSNDEIEILKQQRFDNWINIIKNPPESIDVLPDNIVDTVLDENGNFVPVGV